VFPSLSADDAPWPRLCREP